MKSREEYQASIFAKRDALLRKRRNNITKAVSSVAAAVLLTASVIAVPKMTAKLSLDSEQTIPDITTTQAAYVEENITQQHPDYDSYPESEDAAESSAETASATYSYYITSDETAADAFAGSVDEATPKSTNIAIQSAESTTAEPDDRNIDSAETAGENESFEPDDTDSEAAPEIYAEPSFSYKKIAETAYGFLSEEQKSECIDQAEPEIISAVSASESFYLVNFRTESEKIYQVKLTQDKLELVEINISSEKEQQASQEKLTHE